MTRIAVLPGDGIGPEIIVEAKKVLTAVAQKYNHAFDMQEYIYGGAAIDAEGTLLAGEVAATVDGAFADVATGITEADRLLVAASAVTATRAIPAKATPRSA